MVGVFLTDHPMPALEPAFGEYPSPGDKLLLIGYGRGALMMRVGPVLGYDERGHMMIENFASPGNSGGPVLGLKVLSTRILIYAEAGRMHVKQVFPTLGARVPPHYRPGLRLPSLQDSRL